MSGHLWILGIFTFLQHGSKEKSPRQEAGRRYAAAFPKEPRDTTIRNCSISPPYIPPTVKNSTDGLNRLRQEMRNHNISAYIIPSTDPHLGEYIADQEKRRQWMTGFTGSAGVRKTEEEIYGLTAHRKAAEVLSKSGTSAAFM